MADSEPAPTSGAPQCSDQWPLPHINAHQPCQCCCACWGMPNPIAAPPPLNTMLLPGCILLAGC
eukprot:2527139-Alexandrium_andersonii.AAC.2